MTMPSRFKLAPRSTSSCVAVAIPCLTLRLAGGRFVVDSDFCEIPQRANHLITARDNLIAFIQSSEDFNIGCTGNTGRDLLEFRFAITDHKDALDFFLLRFLGCWIDVGRRLDATVLVSRRQVPPQADGQSLNGN